MVQYKYDAWGNHAALYWNKVNDKEQYSEADEAAFDENYAHNKTLAELNPFRYRGYYYDTETGLYYLKSRYYDPETGRFITIDDISYLAPETINGLNLYAYCGNNPVMRVDANGNAWWDWLLGIVIIVVAVGLSIVTAGIASPIAAALGGGMIATLVGGAVAGAVGGAISAFGVSLGFQGIEKGFGNIDWNQVGKDVLVGAVSGAISGAIFGAVRRVGNASELAKRLSGLEQAQGSFNKAASVLKSTPLAAKGGTMATERLIALLEYNAASANLGIAKHAYVILNFLIDKGYSLFQFATKQAIGGLLNRWM